jgi:sec-independent protein translocase protein TatC
MALTDDRPPVGERQPGRDEATMTLWEHLAELRRRITISVLAIVVAAVVCWFFYDQAVEFMKAPYCNFLRHHPNKQIGLHCQLYITGPLDGFTTRLKVCLYGGFALASPVAFWELWRFVTPGLRDSERRYILPFTLAATVLFALGVTVAILVFPKALQWLIDVSGTGIAPLLSPTRYFTLYVAMCVVFGLVFMYPLLLVSLELAGVVPSRTWRRWRRPAIVVIAIIAAVITPSSDPFSFTAMAVPLYLFYEGSIVLGRLLGK